MKNNWRTKTLGEVCHVIGGGTPSKSNSRFYDGDILWATVRDMKNDFLTDTEFKITKEAVKNSSSNIIPRGNVVIATRVGLGKVCFLKYDTAINQDLRGVVPKNLLELSPLYLFWWFKSIADVIEKHGTGATVHGVKLPFIKGLKISFPESLSEQKRVAKVLNQVFEKAARAKELTEKKLMDLEELEKSILKKMLTKSL